MKLVAVPAGKTRWAALAVLVTLSALALLFHQKLSRAWSVHLLLASNSPSQEFFENVARRSSDPLKLLQACWATGKIVHRELVAGFLAESAATNPRWLVQAEPLLLSATTDADESVREVAMGVLEAVRSPWLFECAQAQLKDVDPMMRLLGVTYLQRADPKHAVPVMMRLLDDPDLRVVAGAEVALMRWSGQDFGVRLRLAMGKPDGSHPGLVAPENIALIERGIQKRKQWWTEHKKDYPTLPATALEVPSTPRPAVPDFTLSGLEGKRASLSHFKGKVVLLNFWATWCTACLDEIPDLIALQSRQGTNAVLIGIALDSVSNDPGGGNPGQVRTKVERTIKARGINYLILLDPADSVGSQYNGGDLPTTVILDRQGRVRRRFIGQRDVPVLEAMLAEAERAPGAT